MKLSLEQALENRIWSLSNEQEFNQLALDIFHYQYEHVAIYRKYCDLLKKNNPTSIQDIPFIPIELFKYHHIHVEHKSPEIHFKSSGTTGMNRSTHYVVKKSLYEKSFLLTFEHFFGSLDNKVILALLPNYIEQGESSLIYMVDTLIQQSNNSLSGYCLNDFDDLINRVESARQSGYEILLFGVSYALLDLAEYHSSKNNDKRVDLKGVRIIETGGMKGRRKEMIKEELHRILCTSFNLEVISSEYGMTELLSQAYSFQDGVFETPPWMKIMIRDAEDPFNWLEPGRGGGISVIDLANMHSCSFINTSDLGKQVDDGFQILGRFDNSDIRGCNLLVS